MGDDRTWIWRDGAAPVGCERTLMRGHGHQVECLVPRGELADA